MLEHHELAVRLTAFLIDFLLMALGEMRHPRRRLRIAKGRRWVHNLALVALNTLCVRSLLPLSAVATAALAEQRNWGLFPSLQWAPWLEGLAAVLALDFAIYLQHVLFHAVPAFWRLHRVHHADLDFDVTTGLRFHTLEILLSALIKVGVVAALGPPLEAVVIFEILLNATAMFNHSNLQLPGSADRWLRNVVVTPDMHRVHHSTSPREANSNFGFNLPWWDFLLGTYLPQPALGHTEMQIGVAGLRDEREVDRLPGMLALPFRTVHLGGTTEDPSSAG